mmetsp:Transcript_49415/g.150364  ORF Transcript_49415/g.150364 Transcript_49415/m.150364 type:complete len:237 (-) Transcript_49415:326-1036(-)
MPRTWSATSCGRETPISYSLAPSPGLWPAAMRQQGAPAPACASPPATPFAPPAPLGPVDKEPNSMGPSTKPMMTLKKSSSEYVMTNSMATYASVSISACRARPMPRAASGNRLERAGFVTARFAAFASSRDAAIAIAPTQAAASFHRWLMTSEGNRKATQVSSVAELVHLKPLMYIVVPPPFERQKACSPSCLPGDGMGPVESASSPQTGMQSSHISSGSFNRPVPLLTHCGRNCP